MSTDSPTPEVLEQLRQMLEARKGADPDSSYVASLYHGGAPKILKKVGEEAVETIIAAGQEDREQIVYETADLWFHCLVMLSHFDLGPDDVLRELERRVGTSGHDEKASRK